MQERYDNLRRQVDDLLKWKEDNERVQVPLSSYGANTIIIMQKDHLVVQPTFNISGSTAIAIEVINQGDIFYIPAIINP